MICSIGLQDQNAHPALHVCVVLAPAAQEDHAALAPVVQPRYKLG